MCSFVLYHATYSRFLRLTVACSAVQAYASERGWPRVPLGIDHYCSVRIPRPRQSASDSTESSQCRMHMADVTAESLQIVQFRPMHLSRNPSISDYTTLGIRLLIHVISAHHGVFCDRAHAADATVLFPTYMHDPPPPRCLPSFSNGTSCTDWNRGMLPRGIGSDKFTQFRCSCLRSPVGVKRRRRIASEVDPVASGARGIVHDFLRLSSPCALLRIRATYISSKQIVLYQQEIVRVLKTLVT